MAYPTSMYVQPMTRYNPSGITVEVYPSTVRGLRVELQTSTANSTVSSNWGSHIFGPSTAGALRYTVPLAPSTKLYYFRARHPAGNGFSAGPFTPTISARPKLTPDIIRPFVMQMTHRGNVEAPSGSDIFVTSAKTVRVGTQVTTGNVTKTLRIPFAEFVPDSSTQQWDVNAGHLRCGVANTQLTARAVAIPPLNVRLKAIRCHLYRESTLDTAKVAIVRLAANDSLTPLTTVSSASTGWQTPATTLNETASTGRSYLLNITLKGVASRADARWSFTEIDYESGSVTETL